MRLLTQQQARKLDRRAELEFNQSSESLQEAAGQAVMRVLREHTNFKVLQNRRKKILVLAGPGRNGCDGFVVARLLKRAGLMNVKVLIFEMASEPSALWEKQKERALAAGVSVEEGALQSGLFESSEADLIIDAVFGTGLSRDLSSDLVELFTVINGRKKPVIAVDLPTGLDCNTGRLHGGALRAQITVTFGACKPGLVQGEGPAYIGRLIVDPISFQESLIRNCSGTHYCFGAQAAKMILPSRPRESHKSSYGRLVVMAGDQFPGAAVLVCEAALRLGVGYVELVTEGHWENYLSKIPEVIFTPRSKYDFKSAPAHAAYVVGPGMDDATDLEPLLKNLIKYKRSQVLLDAQALRFLATTAAGKKMREQGLPATWILTPHPGEMTGLCGKSIVEIQSDRLEACRQTVMEWGCGILLKGYRSILTIPSFSSEEKREADLKSLIIMSGNSALAKAGSGDVLAGMIGSLMAQGLSSWRAGALGAWFHGHLADLWLKQGKDRASLRPHDLIEMSSEVLYQLRHPVKKNQSRISHAGILQKLHREQT